MCVNPCGVKQTDLLLFCIECTGKNCLVCKFGNSVMLKILTFLRDEKKKIRLLADLSLILFVLYILLCLYLVLRS